MPSVLARLGRGKLFPFTPELLSRSVVDLTCLLVWGFSSDFVWFLYCLRRTPDNKKHKSCAIQDSSKNQTWQLNYPRSFGLQGDDKIIS